MLGVGECNVKEENIEEVTQVLDLLRVEANLSQSRKNIEHEHIGTSDTAIELEIKLEPVNSSDGKVNKIKNKLLEIETYLSQSEYEHAATNEEDVKIEKKGERPAHHSYHTNKKRSNGKYYK